MNKNRAFLESSLSLAIAANLGAGIISNITGNAVGSQVEGATITRRSALTIFSNRLTASILANREVGAVVGLVDEETPLLGPIFDTAASLAEAGIVVKTKEGTPVNAIHSEATRAIASMALQHDGTMEEQAAVYKDLISSMLYGGAESSSVFATSEETVALGSRAVGSLTSLCHTHINPFINDALEHVRSRFKSLYLDQSNAYAIREQYLHPLLSNPIFVDHIEGYAKDIIPTTAFAPMIGTELLSNEFTASLLMTGINSIDEVISKVVADESLLIVKIRDLLAGGKGNLLQAFGIANRTQRTKELIFAFLILRSMTLPDYQQRLVEGKYGSNEIGSAKLVINHLLGQVAGLLGKAVKDHKEESKNGTLVLSYATEGSRRLIDVNGDVYQEFLARSEKEELGIDVESILLAALFSNDKSVVTVRDFIEDSKRLTERYRSHRAEMEAATQGRIVTTANTALYQGIRAALSSALSGFDTARAFAITAVENKEDYPEDVGTIISDYTHRVSTALGKLPVRSPDDFEWATMNVICNVFYPHTDALKFFKIYDSVGNSMPEAEAREVAAVAAIDYTYQWLGAQFITTDNAITK